MGSLKKDNNDLRTQKRLLRAKVKQEFKKQPKEELVSQRLAIEERLQALPRYRDARVIMFYWALPGEVETKNLIRKAKERQKTVTLPVVIDRNQMQPWEFTSEDNLVEGALGAMQPRRGTGRKIGLDELDVVIVPGIAFDKSGKRLGRGRGCYDNFLKRLSAQAATIGLAFRHQIVENLPFNSLQDKKVDLVIWAQ
jgi:5-formyltetrahydrofolate cyclo-ligase